jgi:hypothetical protein
MTTVSPFGSRTVSYGIEKPMSPIARLLRARSQDAARGYHTGALRARLAPSQVLPLVTLLALGRGARAQGERPPAAPETKVSARLLLSDLEPLRDRGDRQAELFYAAVRAELARKGWGARAELRGTDGRFRPYFRGDVWLEEGYAFFSTPLGELRAGKLERSAFLADDTFGGNLLSLNGLTRNPDFGAGLYGDRRFGWNELSWSLAYFGQNDHVAFERDGFGVESDPAAKLRDGLEARAGYKVNRGLTTFTPAVSFATARIVRETGPEVRRNDVGADFTATLGPLSLALGVLGRRGESVSARDPAARLGYDDAWGGIAAFRAEFPTVVYRYTYTEWRSRGADTNERLHQPAVVWTPVKGVEAAIEFEGRRLRRPAGARVYNALRFGLTLHY